MDIQVPDTALLLGVTLFAAAMLALAVGRRGGRFRGLPGWFASWFIFAGLLVGLSRGPRWLSFGLLALVMFAALKTYFFIAPVRPRDRYAILAAYASIPFVLYPAMQGSDDTFVALVPVSLFLVLPLLLSLGPTQAGLLDSMGRIMLGVVFFLYGTAHIGLLVHEPVGTLELFGAMALGADLPQRLAGRFRPGKASWGMLPGLVVGLLAAMAMGYFVGPAVGLGPWQGATAGALVTLGVTAGAIVSYAVARDLGIGKTSALLGRGAFLDRAAPVVYAAPVFYHYLALIR